MKLSVTAFAVLAIAASASVTTPLPAQANPIERACNQSDRSAATRAMCDCIGNAAEQTLSGSEMRAGARFFSDPQRAQDVRQSDRRSDEQLWLSWRAFGERAEAMCG